MVPRPVGSRRDALVDRHDWTASPASPAGQADRRVGRRVARHVARPAAQTGRHRARVQRDGGGSASIRERRAGRGSPRPASRSASGPALLAIGVALWANGVLEETTRTTQRHRAGDCPDDRPVRGGMGRRRRQRRSATSSSPRSSLPRIRGNCPSEWDDGFWVDMDVESIERSTATRHTVEANDSDVVDWTFDLSYVDGEWRICGLEPTEAHPPGWYPDPVDGAMRWWDGVRWGATRNSRRWRRCVKTEALAIASLVTGLSGCRSPRSSAVTWRARRSASRTG